MQNKEPEFDTFIEAARNNNLDVVQELLPVINNVNSRYGCGYNALQWASMRGFKPIVECLLAAGADVNFIDNDSGSKPMHLAAFSGQLEIVRLLLANGADMDQLDSYGCTAFMDAAIRGHQTVQFYGRNHG